MRLARVLFMVALVGFCAVVARADSTDPVINMHDPDPAACPTGAYCVNLSYDNTSMFPVFVNILFPDNPPSGVPDQSPFPLYSCDSTGGAFIFFADTVPFPALSPPATFLGCDLLGFLPPGISTFTLSADGAPVVLGLPAGFTCQTASQCPDGEIDLTPEPGTGILFMSGLLLVGLAGFARKSFGANLAT
jgi:hypothetical protein